MMMLMNNDDMEINDNLRGEKYIYFLPSSNYIEDEWDLCESNLKWNFVFKNIGRSMRSTYQNYENREKSRR